MKLTAQMFQEIIGSVISEQQWNKDSNTPRDYSEEYNPPGSQEQEERNKRKRDKRKHDKEHGECPEGEELHHVDGIDGDMLECEPVSTNRGRKEKSRLKKGEKEKKDTKGEKEKKGEIVIKIAEHQLKEIIQEETEKVLGEGWPKNLGKWFNRKGAKFVKWYLDREVEQRTKKGREKGTLGPDEEAPHPFDVVDVNAAIGVRGESQLPAKKDLDEAAIDAPAATTSKEPEEEPQPKPEEEKRAQQVSAVHSMLKGEKPKPPAKTRGRSAQSIAKKANQAAMPPKLK